MNKITESNNLNNLDNDFDAMFNLVESKIKNSHSPFFYKDNDKFKGNKIMNKLLSLSQNEPLMKFMKSSKRNNISNNNKYQFDIINYNEEMKSGKKIINSKYRTNYDMISDFSLI